MVIREAAMRNKPNALANILLTVHTWQVKSKEDPRVCRQSECFNDSQEIILVCQICKDIFNVLVTVVKI